MNLRFLCTLLLLPVAVFAAAALPIEFNGVLIQGGKTTVSLLNPNTGTAKWVALGGKFDTYIVTSYLPDPKGADVVVLTKAGSTQTVRIVLKNSLIVATATPTPVTDEQYEAVADNLLQIWTAADKYFLETGRNSVTMTQLLASPDNGSTPAYLKTAFLPVAGENYTGLVIKQGEMFTVTLSDGSVVAEGLDPFR